MRSSPPQNPRAQDDNTIIMSVEEGDFICSRLTPHDSLYLQVRKQWNRRPKGIIIKYERRNPKKGEEDFKAMKALLIIDLLNDFMRPQGALFVGDTVYPLIHFCEKIIPEKRKEEYTIIYMCDTHWEDDEEFQLFPPHAIQGTWGQQVIEELTPQKGDFIIPKRRFSAFLGTELDLLLREKRTEEIEIVGVLTNIGVLYTAAWAQMLHYQVAVYREGVTSNNLSAHEFALKEMEKTLGVKIL